MEEDTKQLSENQVNEVLQFAQGLYSGFSGYGYYANPFSTNQNLVSLNNSPNIPTYDKLLKALENSPMDYKSICGYSEFMETYDTIYGKTLRYMAGLLAFDLTLRPTNIKNVSEYKSQEYKDDLKRVYKFLDNFDYKQEFTKVVKEVLRRETSYVWFRDSHSVIDAPIDISDDITKKNEKFALQIMPQEYCLLTGYFDSGQLLYDFNLNYFLQSTVDINLFAPALKRKYRDLYSDGGSQKYIPSAQLGSRNGSFSTYVQCSPNDGAYAFKMDTSNFRQIPPFASLMKSAFDNTTTEKLQRDKNIASAYALLMGEIKTFDGAKSGEKPNQFTITADRMGQFLQLVQNGLQSNVRPVALPLEETQLAQFVDSSPLMANYQIRTSASQGASASTLIYTDTKMAQFEMEQAIMMDYNYMATLYNQFNAFMNFFVNKKMKKYRFAFEFKNCSYPFYKEKKLKQVIQCADKGIVLDESEWAGLLDMKPQDFHRSLELAHYSDFTSNLTMLLNINTTKDGSGESTEVGNQELDDDEVSDSGATAREYSR